MKKSILSTVILLSMTTLSLCAQEELNASLGEVKDGQVVVSCISPQKGDDGGFIFHFDEEMSRTPWTVEMSRGERQVDLAQDNMELSAGLYDLSLVRKADGFTYKSSIELSPDIQNYEVHFHDIMPKDSPESSWDFTMYPNPAGQQITLEDLPVIDAEVLISDIQGKEVKRILKEEMEIEMTIPTSSLPNGDYTVQLLVDGAILATKKLVVQQ